MQLATVLTKVLAPALGLFGAPKESATDKKDATAGEESWYSS
jgi:hypothetical protein